MAVGVACPLPWATVFSAIASPAYALAVRPCMSLLMRDGQGVPPHVDARKAVYDRSSADVPFALRISFISSSVHSRPSVSCMSRIS